MLKTEKNRYLELNGDNVEHGKWRRRFTSVAFSTMAITQGLTLASNDKPLDNLIYIPAQMMLCFLTRRSIKRNLKLHFKDTQNKVIDTNPIKPNPTAPSDLDSAGMFKFCETFACVTLGSLVYVITPDNQNPLLTTFMFSPLLAESLASAYRMHKVTRGDWAIIDRDQMKKVEEREPAKTNLQLAPNLVPVKF